MEEPDPNPKTLRELLEECGDPVVRFWVCPDLEHRKRKTVTVEWRDGIAHCTAPGCTNTSKGS